LWVNQDENVNQKIPTPIIDNKNMFRETIFKQLSLLFEDTSSRGS